MTTKQWVALCTVLSVLGICLSCSSGPAKPEKGTPGFYWQAAQETYAAGDYAKTLEHLDNVLATDNEFTAKALPWALVLRSGAVAGYMELGDDFIIGARTNKSDPASFRRHVSDYRGEANRQALLVAENFGKIGKLKDDKVTLAFAFPKGSGAPVAGLNKVTNGILLPDLEVDNLQKRVLERGVVLAACRAAGAPEDSAKAATIYKDANAQVDRATFMLAMAQTLFEESQLYVADKLDIPDKMNIFCGLAQQALTGLPESKESKELSAKITKATKKGKKA
jgi:hypothetical protein